MNGSRWRFPVFCLTYASLWPALAVAEPGPTAGVLVLRNGNVLQGAVRQAGTYYRVDTANVSLQVPAEQVEMFCANLDEAYESRRRSRAGSTADSHLELARWCLRLDLLDHASRELGDAREMDPRHPGLSALELQLRQLLELETASRGSGSGALQSPQPSSKPGASGETLPTIPFEISAEARARFVRSIQPMLIHTCATGGCHQPAGRQRFQLDRWALAGNGNATLIRRNLAAVLTEVLKENPTASPLAIRAGERHGVGDGAASRPLDARQTTILREWLDVACGVKPQESGPGEAGAPGTNPIAAPLPTPIGQTGAPTFVPRDAFDAEIFNRRQSPLASDATAQSQPAAQ